MHRERSQHNLQDLLQSAEKAAIAAGNLLEAAIMQRKCSLKQWPPMMRRHTNTSQKSFFRHKHSLMIVEHNKRSTPKQNLECADAWLNLQNLHSALVHFYSFTFTFQGDWALGWDANSSIQVWGNNELDWKGIRVLYDFLETIKTIFKVSLVTLLLRLLEVL